MPIEEAPVSISFQARYTFKVPFVAQMARNLITYVQSQWNLLEDLDMSADKAEKSRDVELREKESEEE